ATASRRSRRGFARSGICLDWRSVGVARTLGLGTRTLGASAASGRGLGAASLRISQRRPRFYSRPLEILMFRFHRLGLMAIFECGLFLHFGNGLLRLNFFSFRIQTAALMQRLHQNFRRVQRAMAVELLDLFAATETVGDD